MPNNNKQFTIFGIPLTGKQQKDIDDQQVEGQSFVAPSNQDGATHIDVDERGMSAGGSIHHKMNFGLSYKDEKELINKYRGMSLTADVDSAIDEIVNESMSFDAEEVPVEIVLDNVKLSDGIKKKVDAEFKTILSLLDFNATGDDLFRRWYIDGRLFHHVIVDDAKKKDGVTELRYIDPRKIKKVREVIKKKDQISGVETVERIEEYFVYRDEKKSELSGSDTALRIPPEAIIYTHSGIVDEDTDENTVILSYLHKAIKPWNMLNMMEDAEVIYKISRAPERRIFYIDVGNLPKTTAEEYMNNTISKYKNKMVFDSNTGTVKDSTHTMSMLEDIWLPRREGSRGTEVSTLQGGTGLGDIEQTEYYRRKLYRSLHIPLSRLEEGGGAFSLGQSDSITRDELKFSKFVGKLRKRFSNMFTDLLRVQLLLKNIINVDDWEDIKENLQFRYNMDQYFQELKEAEIFNTQLEQLDTIDGYVGRYFSIEFVQKKILKQTDVEIKEIKKQIEAEKEEELMPPDAGYDPQGQGAEQGGEDEEPGAEEPAPESGFQSNEPGNPEGE